VDQFNNPCGSGINQGLAFVLPVAVAVDGSGNMYVTGLTNETDFPNTQGQTVPLYCSTDGTECHPATSFLAKFSTAGRLVYSTFLPIGLQVYGLAVDSSGNAYTIGDTNLAAHNFRQFFAFIAKFSPSGNLVYQFNPDNNCKTDNFDSALSIALNSSGTAAYVAGISTRGGCVHTSPGAYQTNPNLNPGIWAIKVNISNPNSASLIYGTYIGPSTVGSGSLTASQQFGVGGIAADAQGNTYLTGWISTQGKWPTTAGAYRTTSQGGSEDAFVTKLNPTFSGLVYSTYLGGSGDDLGLGVRVDSVGDAYVTGSTTSSNFPHTAAFGSGSGDSVSFVTRLNPSGNGLVYSTVLHGASASGVAEEATPLVGNWSPIRGGSNTGIALDSSGNAYVTGFTFSLGFPTANPFQATRSGDADAFFTNLSTSGSLLTSSYLGGSGTDGDKMGNTLDDKFETPYPATSIAVDKAWNSYVIGTTDSSDFPTTVNAIQRLPGGGMAMFLTKIIIESDLLLTASPSPSPVTHGANLTYTYGVTNKGPDNSDGDTLTTTIPSGTTFQSFSTTAGTCSHPALNGTGTFTCSRGSLLLAGHSWGPITLTVKVNAASGTTVTNTAKVTAKTQDVNSGNNRATLNVHVQ